MSISSVPVLHRVGERIVARWLKEQGHTDVLQTNGRVGLGGKAVDITFTSQGSLRRVKVKVDPYYGLDTAKIGDRTFTFYRQDQASFAFEAVANAATREPGWVFGSDASHLYYYFLALGQPEDEIRALADEPDEVFFGELIVDRDELIVIPMRELSEWFESTFERYTPRPVTVGGASAWYRVVPRVDLERAVPKARSAGAIFHKVVR